MNPLETQTCDVEWSALDPGPGHTGKRFGKSVQWCATTGAIKWEEDE